MFRPENKVFEPVQISKKIFLIFFSMTLFCGLCTGTKGEKVSFSD
jgi:hypothetical protein